MSRIIVGRADFNYRIIRWMPDGKRIFAEPAGLDHIEMAIAAYVAARNIWPSERITLQNGARVIRDSNRETP